MSTNCYHYDERWYFEKKPSVYHGWALTTSSSMLKLAHFKSRRTCNEIEKTFKPLLPPDVREDVVALCVAVREIGGGDNESDRSFARLLLDEEFENAKAEMSDALEDKLEEIIRDYASKE